MTSARGDDARGRPRARRAPREPTVFIVDDDPAMRESLIFLLGSVGLPARAFADAASFVDAYDPDWPGCLILDVRMPRLSGLALQEKMRDGGVEIPIIMVSAYGDVGVAVRSMKAGAVEFLEKPLRDQELLDSVNLALEKDRTRRAQRAQLARVEAGLRSLTARERQVMRLVVDGKANKQTAAELGLSQKTVEVHRARVLAKLGVTSTAELVRVVVEYEAAQRGGA
jgi:two-component system, LuxR family, response regulator FixJ